jgi:hypothetical protein
MTYAEIRKEYEQRAAADPALKNVAVEKWAELQDQIDQKPGLRASAYAGGMVDRGVKQASYAFDQLLSPVSDVTAEIGRGIDTGIQEGFGYDTNGTIESVGRYLPRGAVEFAPFSGPLLKGVSAAQRVAQLGGMASAAASQYADTENPISAAVQAASLPFTAGLMNAGERVALNSILKKTEQQLAEGVAKKVGANVTIDPVSEGIKMFLGQNIGAFGADVATAGATSMAEGQGLDALKDPNTYLASAVGNLAELPAMAVNIVNKNTNVDVREARNKLIGDYIQRNEQKYNAATKANAAIDSALGETTAAQATGDLAKAAVAKTAVGDPTITSPVLDLQKAEEVSKIFAEAVKEQPKTDVAVQPEVELSEMQSVATKTVNTPEALAKLVNDVNTATEKLWQAQFSVDPLAVEPTPFRVVTTKNGMPVNERGQTVREHRLEQEAARANVKPRFEDKGVLSTTVLYKLEEAGVMPRITPEWLKERLGEQAERSLTDSFDEPYSKVVQTIVNLRQQMARDVKEKYAAAMQQKSASSTGGNTLETIRKTDKYFVETLDRLKGLSPTLYESVLDKSVDRISRTQSGEEARRAGYMAVSSHPKTGNQTSRWEHFKEIVTEAVNNYDSATGNTTVGGKTRTLDEALSLEPDWRRLSTAEGGKQSEVSFDVAGRDEVLGENEATTVRKEDLEGGDTTIEAPKAELVQDDDGNIVDSVTALEKIEQELGSDSESVNKETGAADRQGKVLDSLLGVYKQSDAESKVMMDSIFGQRRGAAMNDPALFKLAVEAEFGSGYVMRDGQLVKSPSGRDTRMEFAKKRWELSTPEASRKITPFHGESRQAARDLSNYWTKSDKERFVAQLAQKAGLKVKGEVEGAAAPGGVGYNKAADYLKVMEGTKPESISTGLPKGFREHFESLGYSPINVQFFENVGRNITKVLGNLDDVAFVNLYQRDVNGTYRMEKISEQMKFAGLAGMDNRIPGTQSWVALALYHKSVDNPEFYNFVTTTTAVHELLHQVQFRANEYINSNDPELQRRGLAYTGMLKAMEGRSFEERKSLLKALGQTVIPPQIWARNEKAINDWLNYGAEKPTETVAFYTQFGLAGVVTGGRKLTNDKLVDLFRHSEPDVQNFMRGVYRDVLDVDQAFRLGIKYDESLLEADRPSAYKKQVSDAATIMHDQLKRMIPKDVMVARAENAMLGLVSKLDSGFGTAMNTEPADHGDDFGNRIEASEGATNAINVAKEFFFGKGGGTYVKDINTFTDWVGQFAQVASVIRTGLSMSMADTLLSHTGNKIKAATFIGGPLMTRNKNGSLVFDKNSALAKIELPENIKARQTLNKVLGMLQVDNDLGLLPGAVPAQKAFSTLISSKAGEQYAGMLTNLSPEKRQLVVETADRLFEAMANSRAHLVKSQIEHQGLRTARIMQTIQPGIAATDAVRLGRALFDGVQRRDTAAIQQVLASFDPKSHNGLLTFSEALSTAVTNLESMLASKPYYMSEQRVGKWMVVMKDSDGLNTYHGADSEAHAKKVIASLEKDGETYVEHFDKQKRYGETSHDLPVNIVDAYTEMETNAWNQAVEKIRAQYGNEVASTLAGEFNPAIKVREAVATRGVGQLLANRKLRGGRERLDYIQTSQAYFETLATSTTNRVTRETMTVLLRDKSLNETPKFKRRTEEQLQHVLSPGNEEINKLRSITSGYFLAGNISSMGFEGLQNLTTTLPELIAQGDTVVGAYKRLGVASKRALEYEFGGGALKKVTQGEMNAVKSAIALGGDMTKFSRDTVDAYYLQRFRDENPEGVNAFDDLRLEADQTNFLAQRNIRGNHEPLPLSKLALNGTYQVTKKLMSGYGLVTGFNSKAAFLAAFERNLETGMKHEEAYVAAKMTVYKTLYGGGKANQSGWIPKWSRNEYTAPIVAIASTLQQYGASMLTDIVHRAALAFGSDKRLTPPQRAAARKAFLVQTATQMSLAGALGAPFAGAVLAILEKQFNIDATNAIREGLKTMFTDDEELGNMISDFALNGWANQAFGVDVASRTGLSSFMGFSSYSGFNMMDMFGPAPSLVENMFNGMSALKDGEVGAAAHSLVPQALKNAVTMATSISKYGQVQFMDNGNNKVMDPTMAQAIAYSVGFKPAELSRYQQANRAFRTNNEISQRVKGKDSDRAAAALLQGNKIVLEEVVNQRIAQGLDPRNEVRDIVDRAIDMATPRDLLAQSATDKKAQQLIAKTYPGALNRQSEVQRLTLRENAFKMLGYPYGIKPATRREYTEAQMVDQLVATDKTLSRADAKKRIAETMRLRNSLGF